MPGFVAAHIFSALAESRRILLCGREFYSVPAMGEREVPKDIVVFYPDASRFGAELTPTKTGVLFFKSDAWEVRNRQSAAIVVHTDNKNVKIIEPGQKADVPMGAELFLSKSAHAITLPFYTMK